MKQTQDILFDYLKDILYSPADAKLDLEELPAEFQKLGAGMQFLASCVQEERTFTHALANGDLSLDPPDVENVLAGPAKALQGSLRHLAWQTQQVAGGDYSQHVDFMGEFSEAFNSMTQQLQEHTASLLEEKKRVEQKNIELAHNLALMMALTNYTHNLIFMFSAETGERVFANQAAQWLIDASSSTSASLQEKLIARKIDSFSGSKSWELTLDTESGTGFYSVESFSMIWDAGVATVHIVSDNTARKNREDLLYSLAYVDPLTGLNNRRYGRNLMEEWILSGTPFLLSFIDVDHLKYCNDTFGHDAGDRYLNEVANLLRTMNCEVCRIGGDEFLVLQQGEDESVQDRRLAQLRDTLVHMNDTPYPKSFSYGTSAVPIHPRESLDSYIKATDEKMYLYKQAHKTRI